LEEDLLNATCGDLSKQGQHEQQPAETRGLSGVLPPGVLTQHHLGLVLQVLDLRWVLQSTRLCNRRFTSLPLHDPTVGLLIDS
jgi:hypothetical protein